MSDNGHNKTFANRQYDSHASHARSSKSIKAQVYEELDKNPLLTAKPLCKALGLAYQKYADYIRHIKTSWKYDLKNRVGLKRGKFKNWQGWVYCPKTVDVTNAVEAGWIQTKSKNKYLLWKSNFGRLEWHPKTRRIRVWIKAPANKGKAFQLLCAGFFNTGLIYDRRLLEAFLNSLRFKRSTFILETSQRLPYFKIDFLKDSNGILFKAGDRSHPNCFEITFFYPDWGEKTESVMAKLNHTLEQLLSPKPVKKGVVSYIN